MPTANELLRAARTRLSANPSHACLAPALWSVQIIEDDKCLVNGQPTMGVSKEWELYYHPDVAKWPLDSLETIWLHEIWHLLRSHAQRADAMGIGPQNHMAWNVAADAEINDGLIEARMPFPPGCQPVTPQSLKQPPHLTAEEYYNKLPRQNQGQGQGQGQGQSGKGQAPEFGGSGADGQRRQWESGKGQGQDGQGQDKQNGQGQSAAAGKKRVVQSELIKRQVAENIQKSQGNMPGAWKRWAGKTLQPKRIPWETIIRATIGRLVTAGRREDYTYARPSRRDFPGGFVAPGQFGTIPEIAVGVDTSGSMAEAELAKAVGIVESVLEYHGRTNPVTVISGDTCVNKVAKVLQSNKVELTGGGGTDMRELISYAQKLRPKPSALVLITDGYTPWPSAAIQGMQLVILLVPGSDAGRCPQWATVVKLDR